MIKVGTLYRKTLVNRIKNSLDKSSNVFVLNYSKLSGAQVNDLRKDLKKLGADVFVTKNTLARIALKELKHDGLAEKVSGQTAFIWSSADSVEISKLLVKFTKDSEFLKLQGGLLDGQILQQSDIKKLSDLPSREVLLSMLLSALQSPLTRLASALNAKTYDLLSLLKQISEKKGGS
jgi:large subunit ribosomal protein L10